MRPKFRVVRCTFHRLGLKEARAFKIDLGGVVQDRINHFLLYENAGPSRPGVDVRLDQLGFAGAGVASVGQHQRRLQGL